MVSHRTVNTVKQIREADPNMPAIRISQLTKVSRERVRIILKKIGLTTRVKVNVTFVECIVCTHLTPNKKLCSDNCKQIYFYQVLSCEYCGRDFKLLKSYYKRCLSHKQANFCCSRSCHFRLYWYIHKNRGYLLIEP